MWFHNIFWLPLAIALSLWWRFARVRQRLHPIKRAMCTIEYLFSTSSEAHASNQWTLLITHFCRSKLSFLQLLMSLPPRLLNGASFGHRKKMWISSSSSYHLKQFSSPLMLICRAFFYVSIALCRISHVRHIVLASTLFFHTAMSLMY